MVIVDGIGNSCIDAWCRQAPLCVVVGISTIARLRYVVAIAPAIFRRLRGDKTSTVGSFQQTGQQARRFDIRLGASDDGVARELRLDRIPQGAVDDCRMFIRLARFLVGDPDVVSLTVILSGLYVVRNTRHEREGTGCADLARLRGRVRVAS